MTDRSSAAPDGLAGLRARLAGEPHGRLIRRADIDDATEEGLPPNWRAVTQAVRQASAVDELQVIGQVSHGEQVLKAGTITFAPGGELIIETGRIAKGFLCIAARRLVLPPAGTCVIRRAEVPVPAGATGTPGADGSDGADEGQAGDDGSAGGPGGAGASLAMPEICIFIGTVVRPPGTHATLALSFPGIAGGDGGRGGSGGSGGNGAPGRRGASRTYYCKSQPGFGGNGGNGGIGGRGGDAGRGGPSGSLFLLGDATTLRSLADLRLVRDPGRSGRPGSGGDPGPPGLGGEPGAPDGICPGRPERRGTHGSWPTISNLGPGRPAGDGDYGALTFWEFDDVAGLF